MKKELTGKSFDWRIQVTLETVEYPGRLEDQGPVEVVH